ncbi:MAG: indolepyruvate ferredoxin oxidoreductase [Massilia sp.]|nr:indolepyruvate ferredoxin oxidoreductase [Massilia sp.]
MPQSLETIIRKRVEFLSALSMAVAKYYFKLMAYKDEYEVARLYTDGRFLEQVKSRFEGDFTFMFNLAPPLFAKKDARGQLVKKEFGAWMMGAFKVQARLKGLRGGAFDVFGYTAERKMERALIAEYRAMIEGLLPSLNGANVAQAVELAKLPEQIRGFGHVKEKAVEEFRVRKAELLSGNVKKRAA